MERLFRREKKELDLQCQESPTLDCQHKNIHTLNMGHCRLTYLPKQIGFMVNLRELYLSGNKLMTLPDSISKIKNMKILDVSFNYLVRLPESINQLVDLEQLNLQSNILEGELELSGLTKLRKLHIETNLVTKVLCHKNIKKIWCDLG